MVQGKIPVSGASGFGTGDPSATDFYIIIGRTAARIDAHIGSKGFLCVCSLDGTSLAVISLCNVADDLIGKVSAFVQGLLVEHVSDTAVFGITGCGIDRFSLYLSSHCPGKPAG